MSKENMQINTDFIMTLMKYKGLSEKEFADTIGVSHSTVNRVVNGNRGAGNKFIRGILIAYPDVQYSQLFSPNQVLTKGNKTHKKPA